MMGKYVGIEFLRFEYMNESHRNTEVSCRVEATALKPAMIRFVSVQYP